MPPAALRPAAPCSFEWVTCDINSDKELEEIHDLLGAHYVEVRAGWSSVAYIVAGRCTLGTPIVQASLRFCL